MYTKQVKLLENKPPFDGIFSDEYVCQKLLESALLKLSSVVGCMVSFYETHAVYINQSVALLLLLST